MEFKAWLHEQELDEGWRSRLWSGAKGMGKTLGRGVADLATGVGRTAAGVGQLGVAGARGLYGLSQRPGSPGYSDKQLAAASNTALSGLKNIGRGLGGLVGGTAKVVGSPLKGIYDAGKSAGQEGPEQSPGGVVNGYYRVTFMDTGGHVSTDTVYADSEEEARNRVRQMGYYVMKIAPLSQSDAVEPPTHPKLPAQNGREPVKNAKQPAAQNDEPHSSGVMHTCTLCGEEMQVPEELLGQRIVCPNCGRPIWAPMSSGAAGTPSNSRRGRHQDTEVIEPEWKRLSDPHELMRLFHDMMSREGLSSEVKALARKLRGMGYELHQRTRGGKPTGQYHFRYNNDPTMVLGGNY